MTKIIVTYATLTDYPKKGEKTYMKVSMNESTLESDTSKISEEEFIKATRE